jgi:CS domain
VQELPTQEDEGTGLPPNAGNGLDLEKYSWTQSLAELTIVIPVPLGTRGRNCDVSISNRKLRAGVQGLAAVLDGPLEHEVVVDECYWNCDGKAIEITLQKKDGMKWWSKTVEGEPEVNTRKVRARQTRVVMCNIRACFCTSSVMIKGDILLHEVFKCDILLREADYPGCYDSAMCVSHLQGTSAVTHMHVLTHPCCCAAPW